MSRQLANGRWRADWTDADGKRHRPSYRTKIAADRAERGGIDARERGKEPDPVPTLRMFVPQATAAIRPRVASSTWRGYQHHLDEHLLPRVGDVRLDAFSPATLQRLFADLGDAGMSPVMVHRVFSTLSVVLMLGARYGLCPIPSKKILSMPRRAVYVPRVPTVGDVERIAEHVRQDYRALILLCGYAGLRQGEAFALAPEHVDWNSGVIHVRHGLDRDTRKRQETKSRKWRVVTLTAPVAAALRLHMEEGYSSREWLFHREGMAVPHTWFHHRVWTPARKAASVSCRFHDLRHCAATVMAELGGWGPKKVMAELGHHDEAFTLRVYGHLWAEDADVARERLSVALAAAVAEAKARVVAE